MPTPLPYLVRFPIWWYISRSRWWGIFAFRTVILLSDRVAFGIQLRSLFAPYHNDRTVVGRLLGLLFRLCWIGFGLVLLFAAIIVCAVLYVLWLAWPLAFFLSLSHGGAAILLGLLLTLSTIPVYWLGYVLQPKHRLNELLDPQTGQLATPPMSELRDYAMGHARRILRDLPGSFSTNTLVKLLTADPVIQRLFKRMELTDQQVLSRLSTAATKQSQVITLPSLAQSSITEGLRLHHHYLEAGDLFLGLAHISPVVSQIMTDLGIHFKELEQAVNWVDAERNSHGRWKWWQDEHFHRLGGVDRGWTSGWTPTMKHFSTDVTAEVSVGATPYIIGRQKEIDEVLRILERATKNNVLLVGEPGVGKSSIVDGIAQAILNASTSPVLAESRVIQFDMTAMLSGLTNPNELETRLTQALKELTAGKTILFIDAIENLVGQSGTGTVDATATLIPFIESGAIKVVGATTMPAFHRLLEPHATFTQHFQVVPVDEPSPEETVAILQEFAPVIEQRQGVSISLPALKAAVELSTKYIHDRVLPEKAIDLLDETAVFVTHQKRATVEDEDIAAVISEKTGIPATHVTEDEATKLQNLETLLHQRIIGQDQAVNAVANALRRSRAGLRDEHKPMAVFLFVGPTGVGKTELAKTIAESYFGSENAMIRLDMSEYQDPGAIDKLIGSPPGHVNFEAGGQLTNAVRENPFTVVLLDELEKAHPHVLDLFLQVFDDGRLTDSSGRTVLFNQTIIIATSNAGARSIQTAIKQGYKTNQIEPAVKQMLAERYFRPEFLNRFDEIIVFRPLSLEETMQIVRLMLSSVAKEVSTKDIQLTATDDVIRKLAEVGYDPLYGARPLRHMIQDKVENMLAQKILSGELKRGAVVELNNQNLSL